MMLELYEFEMDGTTHKVTNPELSVKEIVGLAGKDPDKTGLIMRFAYNRIKVLNDDEKVNILEDDEFEGFETWPWRE